MGAIAERPLMKPEEVARLLGVTPNTVYKMAERKILKSVKLGIRSVRFRPEDVEALLHERETQAA